MRFIGITIISTPGYPTPSQPGTKVVEKNPWSVFLSFWSLKKNTFFDLIEVFRTLNPWLLLRSTVECTESLNQCPGINPYYLSVGEKILKNA